SASNSRAPHQTVRGQRREEETVSGLGDVPRGGDVALALTPGGDLTLHVDADVRSARKPLLLAHLLVVRPGLVVDADHAAGQPLGRHVDRVADPLPAGHQAVTVRLSFDYQVTGHPRVDSGVSGTPAKPP